MVFLHSNGHPKTELGTRSGTRCFCDIPDYMFVLLSLFFFFFFILMVILVVLFPEECGFREFVFAKQWNALSCD